MDQYVRHKQSPVRFGALTRLGSPLVLALCILLIAAALFGGASRLHEVRLAIVQLASLPLLVIGLTQLARSEQRSTPLALGLLIGAAALPLAQLVPLPPAIWSRLPGRDELVLALDLGGISPGWLPISLTPEKTWRSFLSLLPPIAAFIGVSLCSPRIRTRLIYGLLIFAVASILLGAFQLASGGRFYLWPTTNPGNVVGFFANRNHLATLCLLALPFAAALGGRIVRRNGLRDHFGLWLSVLLIGLLVLAIGIIRSRFGVILLVPTLIASALAAWVAAGSGRPRPVLLGLAGCVALILAFISVYAAGPVLQRFDTTGAPEGRFENWPIVAEAANTYLPLGSGLGSFDPVFRSVEPLERLDPTFFNQAHNEFLETWLEAGWPGAALIGVFLVWFVRRTLVAWRGRISTETDLQRSASIAIGVVLLHSAVDYPLRTETIAVIFAMCCALLEMAAFAEAGSQPSKTTRGRARSHT